MPASAQPPAPAMIADDSRAGPRLALSPADGADRAVGDHGARRLPFATVAVGASAGGVEALLRLFGAMSPVTGCAFVVVIHLSPDHDSVLAALLGGATPMAAVEARDGMAVEADRIHIIPPGQVVRMQCGRLALTPIGGSRPRPMTIDRFMVSLAEDQRAHAIGVVLTGADGDGTLGVQAIHGAGGLTIAQLPASAAYPTMPASAIAGGAIDRQLPIEAIPAAIAERASALRPADRTGAPARPAPGGAGSDPRAAQPRVAATRPPAPCDGQPVGDGQRQASAAAERASVAAVLTTRDGRVMQFFGSLTPYLELPDGAPTRELGSMLGDALRPHWRLAVRGALGERLFGESTATLRGAAAGRQVRIVVLPQLDARGDECLLVRFQPVAPDAGAPAPAPAHPPEPGADLVDALEVELRNTRQALLAAIDELESTNEALRVANEEAMSTNEELQSTNEELETSKEELESLNEELTTVNQQLATKVGELEAVNDDLANLLTSTSMPTLFLDRQLAIRRFTPAATRLFRLIPTDLSRPLTDIAGAVDVDALVAGARSVLDDLTPVECEVESTAGETYLCRTLPYRTKDNRIYGVVLTFSDVTRLKTAAAGLSRFAAVMHASSDAVVVHDLAGRILAWNRGASALYGYSQPEVLDRDIASLLPDDARLAYAQEIERVVAGGEPRGIEVRRRRRDGAGIVVESRLSMVRDAAGRADAVAFIERDVTERKRAEHDLRESELRFRTLADSAPVLIWMCDPDGVITFANLRFAQAVDIAAAALTGRQLADLLEPDDAAHFIPALQRLRQPPAQCEANVRFAVGSGRGRWFKAIAVPRSDYAGPAGVVGTMVDIHAQVEAEQALRDAARSKDQFLAMLGHELRNPLVPICNAAAVLQRIAGDDQHIAWAHATLVRQVGHVTRLVDDLLDISRITQGTMQLKLEPTDLAFVVARAVETAKPLIERKRHRFVCNLPNVPVWVEGDAIRLAQVFENLLTNAAKYTDEQGTLSITLEADTDAQQAVVLVRDSGLGITPAMQPRIFDLFVQDERSVDRSQGGLGIGLALVRHLVDLHGGRVEASSGGAGAGSVFSVTLRLLPTAAAAVRAPSAERSGSRGGKVLIVEDDPDVGESLAVLLRLDGYAVERAVDLASALRIGRSFRPDAVLMDIAMPGVDGYEVARRMRALPEIAAGTVFIGVSGYCQADDFRRSEAAGFAHHLVKPVDPAELDRILRSQIGR